MRFIGQHHIMNQLKFLLPNLYKYRNKGANFLFRGPSGYGKTTMALSVASYLAGTSFQVYLADWTEWKFRKRVIFIDEIHRVKDVERLYPKMDEALVPMGFHDNPHVFLFATNADSTLPEAFTNRCFQFIFDEYSDDELLLIARETISFYVEDFALMEILNAGNRNPREIKSLIIRLNTYFAENPDIIPSDVNFPELLRQVFSIEDGLDTLSRRYLEVLQDIGGTASLGILKCILHVDENTLKQQVEPNLLRKKLIKITSRGRSIFE